MQVLYQQQAEQRATFHLLEREKEERKKRGRRERKQKKNKERTI